MPHRRGGSRHFLPARDLTAVAARAISSRHVTSQPSWSDTISRKAVLEDPNFDFGAICLPPSTYAQEKHKVEVRWPAAVDAIMYALHDYGGSGVD